MIQERWRALEELVQAALERKPDQRDGFLKEACPDDNLRREAESLLAYAARADEILDNPVWVPKTATLQPGTSIGPYQIVEQLGAGGMGVVYKARDTRLGRGLALKILPADMVSDAGRRQRFVREAQAASRLNHPNIVTIHDIGEADGIPFIAMEYVPGKTLDEAIPQSGLPLAEALKYAIQIADACATAHAARIVHQDLKPGNVMVTVGGQPGTVKVLDFGLAKLMEAVSPEVPIVTQKPPTQTGMVMGTPAFMSPEQAEGKAVDARSDIFSFGAVLYQMVTGKRAFHGDSTLAMLAAVLHKEPEPLPAHVPHDLQKVIGRCLRKDPARRFQSMADVKVELEEIREDSESGRLMAAESEAQHKKTPRWTQPADRQPSIAVLPFANLSADRDNEYFSDGLAEEIINMLAHIPGLKVIARTSAFAFRGKEQDITKIAEALRVRTILEGSVRRAGNRIRVTAQLISAEDGSHLWSERYDRVMADVFAIQDEIAAAIVAALQGRLSTQLAALRQYTPNLPAYEALLKARYHFNKLNPESMARARECFEQAIALDPGYALPHSELGVYFIYLAAYGMRSAREAMPLARVAARKALEIDPSLPEALAVLGRTAAIYDYDWKEAERLYRLAMAREPVPPRVRQFYAFHLLFIDQPERAAEELGRALQEDPLNLYFRHTLVASLLLDGRDADAAVECRRILELDENYYVAYAILSDIHFQQGKLEEGLTFAEKAHSLAPWYMLGTGMLAGLLRRTGDVGRAATLLQKLGDGKAYGAPLAFCYCHLVCSEINQAADWAEKAIEQRDPMILYGLRLPSELRSSSRWPALAKMMNLPEAV